MHWSWDWDFVWEIMPDLLRGFRITILATFGATAVSLALGLFWALVKRSRHVYVRAPVIGFTEFIRGTPLLLQLYFLFFILPKQFPILAPFDPDLHRHLGTGDQLRGVRSRELSRRDSVHSRADSWKPRLCSA